MVYVALQVVYLVRYIRLEQKFAKAKERQVVGMPLGTTPMRDAKALSGFNQPEGYKYPWEIEYSELKFVRCIAKGANGQVFKGTWLGTVVAIKLPHAHLSDDLKAKMVDEAHLMSSLHHPNIVMFLGACLQKQKLAIVVEFLPHGSLADYIADETNNIDLALMHRFAVDIARGMKYLHRYGIIQRDLKPQNLLIDDARNVKVCDFGLSRHLPGDAENLTACGTPYWTAPEVITCGGYNHKADVFSFAIILFELVSREEPYVGQGGLEVAIKVAHEGLRPTIPSYCPDEYASLIKECWDAEPDNRPDFQGVLERLNQIKKSHQQALSAITQRSTTNTATTNSQNSRDSMQHLRTPLRSHTNSGNSKESLPVPAENVPANS